MILPLFRRLESPRHQRLGLFKYVISQEVHSILPKGPQPVWTVKWNTRLRSPRWYIRG